MSGPSDLLRRHARPLVLALDLSRPVIDAPGAPPLARLRASRSADLREVVVALDEAAHDPRIAAVVAKVDAPAASWAHAQELHAAVRRFRAQGKPALAHAQSFSEAGAATLAYLVASAFDEVALQPTGELAATGVAVIQPFLRGLLDHLEVDPQLEHRHEYKTARNLFTERGFTEAHREVSERIVEQLHTQLVDAVVDSRGLPADRVRELIDRAPLSAPEALEHGLVDRLAYRDETVVEVLERAGEGATLVTLSRYRTRLEQRRRRQLRRPTVALIPGAGGIQVGRGRDGVLRPVMGADTLAIAFHQARTDPKIKAVVFRVESPGGSAVASDAIWRSIQRTREAGTPVVVSMGAVAGSGGYWVALGADRIIASAGTLTGSIGVVYGKLVVRGFGERLGITTDEAHRGANALLASSTEPYTDAQREQVAGFLDHVYDAFLTRVADTRPLSRDQVAEVARGRVWTGDDALDRGLIDELGGYHEAFVAARKLAGIAPDRALKVRVLPRLPLPERFGLKEVDDGELRTVLGEAGALLRAVGGGAGVRAEVPDVAARLGRHRQG